MQGDNSRLGANDEHPECYNKLLLSPDAKLVYIFSAIIIAFSGFSTVLGAYFACFGEPDDGFMAIFDTIMEICFIVDMFKNFFMKYTDPREPRKPVKDLAKIIVNYVKGAFFFDFIACIGFPLRHALRDNINDDNLSLLYLLRMFRLSKILILLDPQRFTRLIRNRYRKNLKRMLEQDRRGDIGNDRMTDNNKIMHQIYLRKGFQVFRIVCIILFLSYFLGTFWFIITKHATFDDSEYTFYNEYALADQTNMQNSAIIVYFMFTTLSTVGLGDFNPKSEIERLIMCLVLLLGVTCFAYIMSVLVAIVQEVQVATAEPEESQKLSRWLLLLQHFNKNKPLPAEMIAYFEKYFEYFWRNDKNSSVDSDENMALMSELPNEIRTSIFKDFLFEDFLEQFKVHFVFEKPKV